MVVLAALINSLKLKKLSKEKAKIVLSGAGAAGMGIVELLKVYGFKYLVVCDSQGAIHKNRKGLAGHKIRLGKLTNKNCFAGCLADCLKKADIFIGVSVKNILTEKMVKTMNEKPVIFALANPVPEINPILAKKAGAFIVATGRSDFPNQLNNVLAFPGIFRGALDNNVRHISQKMLMRAANNLAGCTKNLSPSHILPDPFDRGAARAVASAIK